MGHSSSQGPVPASAAAAPAGPAPAARTRWLTQGPIPRWLAIAHTLFMCVLAPVYWHRYGAHNFLWFCDIALFLLVPALWLRSRFLLSLITLMVGLPQVVWVVDYLVHLTTGWPALGASVHMFDRSFSPWVRALGFYHAWMPVILFYGVRRLGYDRRAFPAQIAFGLAMLVVSYLICHDTRIEWANLNWVLGPKEGREQTWMDSRLYLALIAAVYVLLIYTPTHLFLRWWGRKGIED